jgi:putative ABC transport system permease protein
VNAPFRLRLIWRALWLRKRRLSVAVLALVVGASVASALLTTYADLDRKMAGEFRRFGANIVVSPRDSRDAMSAALLEQTGGVPFLYVVGRAGENEVVLAGTDLARLRSLAHTWQIQGSWPAEHECLAGERTGVKLGDRLLLRVGAASASCRVAGVTASGSSEDSQVLLALAKLQELAALPGRLSLIQVSAEPDQVEATRARLAGAVPEAEVRALRPVAESTARALLKIRAMLYVSSLVILGIVGLGVATTLGGIVLERKADIGVMKALGGTDAQIAALFFAESGLLGLAGGVAGCFSGLALAQWVGHAVYQAGVDLRPWVIPQVILITLAVALAATSVPVRFLRGVRPAVVLKGE